MGLHNPLPSSMNSECKKCGKILTSFIDPRQAFGPDKIIPPSVLANAKGLAILTVIKAGFLGSARFGSGLIVSRLPDSTWSAPSAIMTAGGGFGGQIGLEITDFVFILNDAAAVKTFSQAGSVTLGGNVSIAAGPVGRNAEAAGAASLKSVSGVFAYSKTKGLFAGVSLEGSVIMERKDANEKMYGSRYTAQQLLSGTVQAPPQAQPLLNVLNSRVFSGMRSGGVAGEDGTYNDTPQYEERHDDVVWDGRRGTAYGEGQPRDGHHYDEFGHPKRASTWASDDQRHGRMPSGGYGGGGYGGGGGGGGGMGSRTSTFNDAGAGIAAAAAAGSSFGTGKKQGPGRPAAPKPNFAAKANLLRKNEAVALFNFDADQPGDLGFKKGDVIAVLKKTDSENDWWTGMIGTRHGIFPSNYVKMKE